MAYEFSNDWFDCCARPVWREFIPRLRPKRVLEVGSYEGASACFLIDTVCAFQPLELHCVDHWRGSAEHAGIDMSAVRQRFRANIEIAGKNAKNPLSLYVHDMRSDIALPRLLTRLGPNYFDMVYVDGSHEAPDVLLDALLGFKLLRCGGALVFDDYNWQAEQPAERDLLSVPRPAIDAFVNLYTRKLDLLNSPLSQLFVRKVSD